MSQRAAGPMGAINDVIADGLTDLEAGELVILERLALVYEKAYQQVSADLDRMLRTIERAQRDGEDINPDWLRRQDRYRRLLANIEKAYAQAGGQAAELIAQAQRIGARSGYSVAQDLLDVTFANTDLASVGLSSAAVPEEAINRFVSATQPGSPLNQVFGRYGAQAAELMTNTIAAGMVSGYSPRKVGRQLRHSLGARGNRAAMLTIARTEMLRAYRGAQVDQYRRLGTNVVSRVRWVAQLSSRTCLYCLHMHGQTFPIDQAPTSHHPNCRCNLTPVPAVQYASLQQFFQSGEDWLRKQPIDVQLDMIGGNRQAVDAFRDGRLRLANFSGTRFSSVWGSNGYQKSGRAALLGAGISLEPTA